MALKSIKSDLGVLPSQLSQGSGDRKTVGRSRLYNKHWRELSSLHLELQPYCVYCKADGIRERADLVDHIIPHKGIIRLFWDKSNWQSLCERHHNKDKQSIECQALARGDIGLVVELNQRRLARK